MPVSDRRTNALAKLLKLARQKEEECAAHVSDLEVAKASTLSSLDWLAQAIGAEQELVNSDRHNVLDFQNYLNGANQKREALNATLEKLDEELTGARDRLREALAERRKLQHLIEVTEATEQKAANRREEEALDETATRQNQARRGTA